MPVGVDTSQTEFDTVEETGGEKKHIRLLYKKCLAIRIASIEVIMEMRVLKKYHTLMVTIRNGQVRRSNRQEADKPIIISSHTLLVICTSEPHRNKLRDWGLFFLPMPFVFFRDREVDTRNP